MLCNMCEMSTEFASNHVLLQYDFCNQSTMLCLCLCVTKPRRITTWCGHPSRIDRMGSVGKWRRQRTMYRFFLWNGLFACHYNHMVVKCRKTHDCIDNEQGQHDNFITQCFAVVIYLCDSKYSSRHFDPATFYTSTFIARHWCNYFNTINAIHFVTVTVIQRPRAILPFQLLSNFFKLPN